MDYTHDKNNKPARLNAMLASVHSPDWEFEFFSSHALSETAPAGHQASPCGGGISVCSELGNASNIPSEKLRLYGFVLGLSDTQGQFISV